jgi:hypothetical protein
MMGSKAVVFQAVDPPQSSRSGNPSSNAKLSTRGCQGNQRPFVKDEIAVICSRSE